MHAAARDQNVPAARAPAAGTGAVCAQLAGHGQHRYLLPRFSSRTTVVGIPLIVAHDFRTTDRRLSSSATPGHTLTEVQIMRSCNNALASAPQASTRSVQQNCSAQSSLKTGGPVLVGATSGLSHVLERVETVAPALFPHIRRCCLKMHDDLLALRHFVVWGTAQM